MISTSTINFLNSNSGAIQAFSTILLVIITAYYAFQTRKTVREMKNSREDARLPIIRLSIDGPYTSGLSSDYSNFDFKFENIGYGLALDVIFKLPTRKDIQIGNVNIGEQGCHNLYLETDETKKLLELPASDRFIYLNYKDIFDRKITTICYFEFKGERKEWRQLKIINWRLIL